MNKETFARLSSFKRPLVELTIAECNELRAAHEAGYTVQFFNSETEKWCPCVYPIWFPLAKYRLNHSISSASLTPT